MKVLWITNIVFPEAQSKFLSNSELKSSGGWMLGAAENLVNGYNIELYVASVSPLVNELQRIEGEEIVYYIIPYGKGNLKPNPTYQEYWLQIRSTINPDIVHIHGTEFSHGYEYLRACGNEKVLISIQGMKSSISYYYHYGISKWEILRNITLRDILKGSMLKDKRDLKASSEYEVAMFKMAKYIIGRTSWDRAKTWAINPNAHYYSCNETLRAEFYDGSMWDYDRCTKHTIFLSQAGYPIKGLHHVLKAMPLILRHYPDTTIRIAGKDITRCNTFKDFVHYNGYGRYIKNLICTLKLEDRVKFVGNLNAEEMKREYLNSNLFLCSSSIENSPNSLGEAQILGVPCVASYVGGVPDMMDGAEAYLYRFEEVEMLALKICDLFSSQYQVNNITLAAAKLRHDRVENSRALMNIYSEILSCSLLN